MGNHYLPQHYLRGFAPPPGISIWAHDRKLARTVLARIRDVGHETNLYPDALEQALNIDVEQPGNAVLDKIRAQQPLSPADRTALARYMVTLWKRVPRARQRVAERVPAALDELHQGIRKGLDDLVQTDPTLAERAEARKQEVAQIVEKFKVRPPPEIWHHSISTYDSSVVTDMLEAMTWRVCVSSTGGVVTGDNPVFFFENEGIKNPRAEVSFPIATNCVLWATWRPLPTGEYLDLPIKVLHEFNRRTVSNAVRFVFSITEEEWILTMLAKPRIRLSRIL